MQHDSQDTNPYVAALSREQRAVLDSIRARSIARFGFDAFRMEGGDGGDGGSGDGGDQADQGSGDSGSTGDAGGQGSGDDGPDAGDSPWDDPAKAKAEIERLRRENASARTNAKTKAAEEAVNELTQKLGKALGLIKDGDKDKVDPADAIKQAQQAQETARQSQIELAVYKNASKHQGDPDALLDSRGFLAKLADLDPADAKFQDKVADAIKQAVADNPKLKATQAAGSSSADHGTGGSGEQTKRTPKSLTDAVAGAYGTA